MGSLLQWLPPGQIVVLSEASGDAPLEGVKRQAAFQQVLESWRRLNVVASNAGTLPVSTPAEHLTLRQWEDTFAVHCTGYFLVAREAVRVFRSQGRGGALILVSSDNGLKPSKEVLVYNCANAAELHMARCLAEEYGPHGIRVKSVLPGGYLAAACSGSRSSAPPGRRAMGSIPIGSKRSTRPRLRWASSSCQKMWQRLSCFSPATGPPSAPGR